MAHSSKLNIGRLCQMARVSRSGYYEWMSRPESFRDQQNRRLLVFIKVAFEESRHTYGAIRIHQEIRDQGLECGKNRVARLMRLNEIRSIHRRPYRPQTTKSNHNLLIADNILNQDFNASGVNQKWGGDISYIPTAEGWLYISALLDFYSRKVIGFSTSSSLHSDLCCQALNQACLLRKLPSELIHHSDRGVQYASEAYCSILKKYNFEQSMSRKGNCYDNAMVESFFHTLKVELTNRRRYQTRKEAKKDIENYIHTFYNPKRRHSSLDYRSPNDYEYINRLAA